MEAARLLAQDGEKGPMAGASLQQQRKVFLYKLPRRPSSAAIEAVASLYGEVEHVAVNMGRGQALVSFTAEDAARALWTAAGAGKVVIGGRTAAADHGRGPMIKRDTSTPTFVRRECTLILNDVIRQVCTRYGDHRHQLRLARKRAHKELVSAHDRAARQAGAIDFGLCWDFARFGRCKRGDKCTYTHSTAQVSISALPPSLRLSDHEADRFPQHREDNPHKARVNRALVTVSEGLENRRCLVLDGPAGRTVQALRACRKQHRTAEDVHVPNIVTETYMKLKRSGACTPYHGSLRAFLDSHPGEQFGLVYLDYCGRLYAGKGHVEKSPVNDIQRLFALHALDDRGCVLAVCLREEGPDSTTDAPQRLRHLVCRLAAEHGMVAIPHVERYAYEGNFVEVFFVCAPAFVASSSYMSSDYVAAALDVHRHTKGIDTDGTHRDTEIERYR